MAEFWPNLWKLMKAGGKGTWPSADEALDVLSFGGRSGAYKDQFEKMLDLSKLDLPNRTYNGIPFDKYKEMADASPTPQERWHNLAAYEILNAPDFAEKQAKKAASEKAVTEASGKQKPAIAFQHPESDIAATSAALGTVGGSSALKKQMAADLLAAQAKQERISGPEAGLDAAKELGVIPRGPGMRAMGDIPAAAPAAPQIPVIQGIESTPPKTDMGIKLMDPAAADRALQRPGPPDVGMALQNILGGMSGAAPRVRQGTPSAVPGGAPRIGIKQPGFNIGNSDITRIGGQRTDEQDAELKALARSGDEAAYQKRKAEVDGRATSAAFNAPAMPAAAVDEDRTDPSGIGVPEHYFDGLQFGPKDPRVSEASPGQPPDLKQMLMAALAGNSPDVPGQDPLQGQGPQPGSRFPYLAGMPGGGGGDRPIGVKIYG